MREKEREKRERILYEKKEMTVSTMVIKMERLTERKKERQKKGKKKHNNFNNKKFFFREREGDMEKRRENKNNM